MPVQTLDTIRNRLKELNRARGYSWRKIAEMEAYKGIPPGSLCSYSKGREPKNEKHRRILGLPVINYQYRDPITGQFVSKHGA
jgi:hypothetical protein